MKTLRILLLILLAGLLPAASYAGVLLQIDPADAVLTAEPGATVGWGLIFENDTPNYAIWAGTYLLPGPDASVGTFTDFSLFNFLMVGPGATSADQPFDAALPSGAGSFAIDSSAPFGTYRGQVNLVYDLYDADPTSGGPANYLGEFTNSQDFELDVVPEPATVLLLAPVMLLGMALRRRTTDRAGRR